MSEQLPEFNECEGYLQARYFGEFSTENILAQMRLALDECLKRGFDRLQCDTTQMIGDLSFMNRFQLGEEFAEFWPPRIKICVIARLDQIDKGRLAVMVARNRGARVDVFTDSTQALKWLLA